MTDFEYKETIGERSEGDVLQAIAGPNNFYVMVIMEVSEGKDGPEMHLRLPTNFNDGSNAKALLRRAYEALP